MRKNRDLNADLISARESRKDAFVALHAMNDKARDEKRDLTDTEKNEFERLTGDVRLFDNELRRIETIMGVGDHQDARRGNDGNVNDLARRCSLFRAIRHLMNDGNADAGAELEWQQEQLRTMPRTIKGMLFPLREQRALATATGETGGYLVEEELRDDLYIGPLRDRTVAGVLGATILTGLVGDQSIPKQTSAIAGQWVAENQELSEESPTFGQVRLTPKHVGSFVETTRQAVIQGTPSVERIITTDLENQLNIAIDTAALQGTGVDAEPLGIMNVTGVNAETFAADNPTWAELNACIAALDTDNALTGKLGFAMHPSMISGLRTTLLDAGSGRFVIEGNPASAAGYPIANSKLVPYAANASNLFFGNWQDLLIGLWSGVDILINPYSDSVFKKGNVQIRGFQTCDVALRHAESFVRGHKTA